MQFGIGPTKTQRALPPIYPPASSALAPHIWTLLYEAIVWSNVRFNHGEIEEAAVYTYCGYFQGPRAINNSVRQMSSQTAFGVATSAIVNPSASTTFLRVTYPTCV